MFIIGIAGGTGSGKTTVVRKLIERLPQGEVVVIPQDSYYNDSSHVPFEERQNINFDHPDAFDWSLFAKHIEMLKNGESIEQPIYDYITSSRQQETVHVDPREIIIVVGILRDNHYFAMRKTLNEFAYHGCFSRAGTARNADDEHRQIRVMSDKL